MIYEQATLNELRQKAFACGMRTLREDGKRKVDAGLTTIEEVFRLRLSRLLDFNIYFRTYNFMIRSDIGFISKLALFL